MLTESQRERLDVVLVSPRNPLNIGAVARAMANFGLSRLFVVAPYAPMWRVAKSAVGAPQILLDAKESATVAEAVEACTLVIGTGSLTYRKPEQPVVSLPDLAPLVGRELLRGGRVAVVFGTEKHGLTRDDLSYCHMLAEIPCDPQQPSMNLGQAAAVCLYELAVRAGLPERPAIESRPLRAKNEENTAPDDEPHGVPTSKLEILAQLLEETMASVGYSPRSLQEANRHDLRVMLRRMALSEADARRILGLFRRILWRLRHAKQRCD